MKRLLFVLFSALIIFLPFESNSKTITQDGFIQTLPRADSIFQLKILTGKNCVKSEQCVKSKKTYGIEVQEVIFGRRFNVSEVKTFSSLCIECSYYATLKVTKAGAYSISIFPENIITDSDSSENRIRVFDSSIGIPFSSTKTKSISDCGFVQGKMKCEDILLYRYVTQKYFISHLLKTRQRLVQ